MKSPLAELNMRYFNSANGFLLYFRYNTLYPITKVTKFCNIILFLLVFLSFNSKKGFSNKIKFFFFYSLTIIF